MENIIKEPLIHFLAIALLFFVVYERLNSDTENTNTISISDGRITQIKNTFTERWNREPLPKELETAITGYALNQMYLNEARAMNLDLDDQVVDKRLRQKMNYLLETIALNETPSDQELNTYYEENKNNYLHPASFSFQQVFISTEQSDNELQATIASQLARITKGLDPIGTPSLIPATFSQATKAQLAQQFGEEFVALIDTIPAQAWSGPINSSLGKHFVFLSKKTPAQPKPFEEVKRKVLTDWQYQHKKEYQTKYEDKLLAKYLVERANTGAIN